MRSHSSAARSLYLELRALGVKVRIEDNPDGGPLDYGIALDGLSLLPEATARRVMKLVNEHEEELVWVVLDRRDPDVDAVRREGHC